MGRGGSSGGGFSGGGSGGSHHSFSSSGHSRGGSSGSSRRSSGSSRSYRSSSLWRKSSYSPSSTSYGGTWRRSTIDTPTYHSETIWQESPAPVYTGERYRKRSVIYSPKFDLFIWLAAILFCMILYVSMTVYDGSGGRITKSTHERAKLSSEKCIEYDEWYNDGWGDWLNDDVIPGLRHFYKETGVQPYVYIMGGEEAEGHRTESSLHRFNEDLYKKLFGIDDQGHLILTWSEYPNGSGTWVADIYTGTDADLVVDDEAASILQDYLVRNYNNDSMSDSDFIGYAFQDAADRMMTVQKTGKQYTMEIFGATIVCAAAVIVVRSIKKKRKAQREKEKADKAILNSDVSVPKDTKLEGLKEKYDTEG